MIANDENILEIYRTMSYEVSRDTFQVIREWLAVKDPLTCFVDGKFKEASGEEDKEFIKDLCTNETLGSFLKPTRADVHTVFQSLLHGQKIWNDLGCHSRGKILSQIAKKIGERKDLLGEAEALTMGWNVSDCKREEITRAINYFHYYSINAYSLPWASDNMNGFVLVNLPEPTALFALAALVAPALASGSAVLIHAEQQPLTALAVAELCADAGLPPGVVNVLPGALGDDMHLLRGTPRLVLQWGPSTLSWRAEHDYVANLGAPILPFVYGKAVSIIFDSCDKESALDILMKNISFNYYQVPWSVRTLLVEEAAWEAVTTALKGRLRRARVGSARSRGVDVAVADALPADVCRRLRATLHELRARGVEVFQAHADEGECSRCSATLLLGSDAERNALGRERGPLPCVAVLPFRRARDAVAFANKSPFGVAASVWTSCLPQALQVASELQVGTVWINDHGIVDAAVPFGSHKHGCGSIGGSQGLLQLSPSGQLRPPPPESAVTGGQSAGEGEEEGEGEGRQCGPHWGGAWRVASSTTRFFASGVKRQCISLSDCDWNDMRKAAGAAQRAMAAWAQLDGEGRVRAMLAVGDALRKTPQPLDSLVGEGTSATAAQGFDAWAVVAAQGDVRGAGNAGGGIMLEQRVPRGVIAIVADVHTTFERLSGACAAALAMGDAALLLPSASAPMPALELAALVANVVPPLPAGLVSALPSCRSGLLGVLGMERYLGAVWFVGDGTETWEALKVPTSGSAGDAGRRLLWRFPSTAQPLPNCLPLRHLSELWHAATRARALWLPSDAS